MATSFNIYSNKETSTYSDNPIYRTLENVIYKLFKSFYLTDKNYFKILKHQKNIVVYPQPVLQMFSSNRSLVNVIDKSEFPNSEYDYPNLQRGWK